MRLRIRGVVPSDPTDRSVGGVAALSEKANCFKFELRHCDLVVKSHLFSRHLQERRRAPAPPGLSDYGASGDLHKQVQKR